MAETEPKSLTEMVDDIKARLVVLLKAAENGTLLTDDYDQRDLTAELKAIKAATSVVVSLSRKGEAHETDATPAPLDPAVRADIESGLREVEHRAASAEAGQPDGDGASGVR